MFSYFLLKKCNVMYHYGCNAKYHYGCNATYHYACNVTHHYCCNDTLHYVAGYRHRFSFEIFESLKEVFALSQSFLFFLILCGNCVVIICGTTWGNLHQQSFCYGINFIWVVWYKKSYCYKFFTPKEKIIIIVNK